MQKIKSGLGLFVIVALVSVLMVAIGAFAFPVLKEDVGQSQVAITKTAASTSKDFSKQSANLFAGLGDVVQWKDGSEGQSDKSAKGKKGGKKGKGQEQKHSMNFGPVHFV